MIDHAYEKEKAEARQDAMDSWLLEKFEDWCLEIARNINDRPYIHTCYSWKDIKERVKKLL